MTQQKKHYSGFDYEIYNVCQAVSQMSTCTDKQVGSVILDQRNHIVGVGYNNPIGCNRLCNHTCTTIHAEHMAVAQLPRIADMLIPGTYTAYINLYPCIHCQELMMQRGIDTVYVFGKQGNKKDAGLLNIQLIPDLPALFLNFNGPQRCRQIAQGELAELTTAISNLDARDDRPESREQLLQDIIEEYVDVGLQLHILMKGLNPKRVDDEGMDKWNKLLDKFWDKFFPDIDL